MCIINIVIILLLLLFLLLTITHIINKSLSSGVVPSVLKAAVIKTLMKKKTSFDKKQSKELYRPVSNLSFPSKVIEKIVPKQLFAPEGMPGVVIFRYK